MGSRVCPVCGSSELYRPFDEDPGFASDGPPPDESQCSRCNWQSYEDDHADENAEPLCEQCQERPGGFTLDAQELKPASDGSDRWERYEVPADVVGANLCRYCHWHSNTDYDRIRANRGKQ